MRRWLVLSLLCGGVLWGGEPVRSLDLWMGLSSSLAYFPFIEENARSLVPIAFSSLDFGGDLEVGLSSWFGSYARARVGLYPLLPFYEMSPLWIQSSLGVRFQIWEVLALDLGGGFRFHHNQGLFSGVVGEAALMWRNISLELVGVWQETPYLSLGMRYTFQDIIRF
ncbi:hypothetical protein [Spirochaeta thermophila]|uniref:hypothetical protein n=1 Tax=Winmispira thermophila TaxID=154 RepID=UPI000308F4C6|nr:hypothetical protein [Spirochaeta thermophila]